MPYNHVPVMPENAVEYLNCRPGGIYADCTLGGTGHAELILKKIIPDGILIGIDQDKDAIANAKAVLKPFESNIRLFHANFENLRNILSELGISAVDGILLDLGLSLHHLEKSGRGFSFQKDEPLDMRMNINSVKTAGDIVNTADEKSLAEIFRKYGEERMSRSIARRIVMIRKNSPVLTSKQLSEIILSVTPKKKRSKHNRIHPATRVFMALRIAVNKELERLEGFMKTFADILNPGGRLCVLSFHSLEDRIVKRQIRALETECTCPPNFPKCVCSGKKIVKSLTAKPLKPDSKEVSINPMARSAKLRVAEKLQV